MPTNVTEDRKTITAGVPMPITLDTEIRRLAASRRLTRAGLMRQVVEAWVEEHRHELIANTA